MKGIGPRLAAKLRRTNGIRDWVYNPDCARSRPSPNWPSGSRATHDPKEKLRLQTELAKSWIDLPAVQQAKDALNVATATPRAAQPTATPPLTPSKSPQSGGREYSHGRRCKVGKIRGGQQGARGRSRQES